MSPHLFLAGVPATGKSWLGRWLAEKHGYVHIDAERDNGIDFDRAGLRPEWHELVEAGRAASFVAAAGRLAMPVVVDWGFPTPFLYVVAALEAEGVHAWWLHAQREQARTAFIARGGIDPRCFDSQMDNIEREWLLIAQVFGSRIIAGLNRDGSQRKPEDLWSEITAAG